MTNPILEEVFAFQEKDEKPIFLYDYQEPVIDKLMEFVEANTDQQSATGFVVLPGGSGKTVVFSHLVKRLNTRTFIVSHNLTVNDQNIATMRKMNPGLKVSIYGGGTKDLSGDVIYITYPSLLNLLKKKKIPRDFARIVIFDEVDLSLSLERSKIPNMVDALCIGFTATDVYTQEKKVANIFKKEIYRMSLKEAIEMGILVPLRGYKIDTSVDLRNVQLTARNKQLDERVAEKFLNILARNQVARDFYLKNFKGVPAVAFCVSVSHAIAFAKLMNEAGVRTEAIHGGIPKEKRREIYKNYREGRLDMLTTCDILVRGWDEPRVVVALNLCPTYSWVRAEQRACRVTRRFPGKEFGIVVDFQDIYNRKDQHILINHLFGNRTYTQGGYVAAPKRIRIAERRRLQDGDLLEVLGKLKLKISSEVEEVVNLKSLISGPEFDDKRLIRDILLSRDDIDYRIIPLSRFKELEFDHPRFKGNGRQLLARHLGVFWENTALDYELFIIETLHDYFYYELHEPMLGETKTKIEKSTCSPFAPDRELAIEDLSTVVQTALKSLSSWEFEVINYCFGLNGREELDFNEIGDKLDLTRLRVRQIREKGFKKLRENWRSRRLKQYWLN